MLTLFLSIFQVKGKHLEKMLVKWALERRKPVIAKTYLSTDPSTNPSATGHSKDQPQISQLRAKSETAAPYPAATAELDRLHHRSNAATVKSNEGDEDHTLRQIEAEELASNSRDDKLLSLSGGQQIHRQSSYQAEGPTHALTQENMQKLAHERDAEPTHPRLLQELEPSSVGLRPGSWSRSTRPSLTGAHQRESEKTVTQQMR
jgi:hypothetical protein